MSALSIQPVFPIFTDIDGQPLEDGFVWIGVANLQPIGNPINVYWDAALTIPAAQPIRTLGGYPVNSGTPARLYVNSDYSIQVQNKNGSVVYSAPEPTEAYGGGISNASQVVYDPAGLGAVPTTVQTKLRETVSVKDFGAVGDGVTDDTAAIQAAITASASKALLFPAGTYVFSAGLTFQANTDYVFDNATLSLKTGIAVPSALIQVGNGTRIIGMKLNGNKDTQSGNGFGVRISFRSRVVMHNCRIDNILGYALGLYGSNDCLFSDLTINNPGDKTTNPTSYEFGDGIYMGDSANRNQFVNININHDFVSGQTQSGPVRCGIVITDGSGNSFTNVSIENVNRPIQLETDDTNDVIAYNTFSNIVINQRSNSNSGEVIKLEKKSAYAPKIYGNKFSDINARGGVVNSGHGAATQATLYLLAYGPNVYDNVFTNVYAEKAAVLAGSGYRFVGCDIGTLRGGDPAGLDALVDCVFDSCRIGPRVDSTFESNSRLSFTGNVVFNNTKFVKTAAISGHRFQPDNSASGTNALLSFSNCVFEGDLDSGQYLVQAYGRTNWIGCKFNGNRIAGTVQLISLAFVYARRLVACSYRQTNSVQFAITASDGEIRDYGSVAETAMATSLTDLSGGATYTAV
jgi:hypothetical protein